MPHDPPLGTQQWGTVGSGVQPSTLLLLQGGCLRNFRLERIQHLQRAMSWTYGCGSLDTSLFYERTWHECGAPGRASTGGMHEFGQRPNDLRHKHLHRTRRTLPLSSAWAGSCPSSDDQKAPGPMHNHAVLAARGWAGTLANTRPPRTHIRRYLNLLMTASPPEEE